MSSGDPNDPDLFLLLSRALELRDSGREVDLDELCAERPDLVVALRSALERSELLPGLQLATASHDALTGVVLDQRYRLEQRIGSGAMGVVYRAHDLELDREVAVKVLRSTLLDGEDAMRLFQREAQVLAAIRHRAVVTIHDCSRGPGREPYLVIELLEGVSLAQLIEHHQERVGGGPPEDSTWVEDLLERGALDDASYLRNVVRWAAELASGLQAAHDQGIYHRDVKPSNVFLCADGRPVLLDFGIASYVGQGTLTRENSPLGTPAYMAPEALEEKPRPGAPADVYGLTATLYHLLTMRPPYSGSSAQVLAALVQRDVEPARRHRPSLPRDLQAILECGLSRRPQDRYPTAAALEEDLRAFLDHRPVRARSLPAVARLWRRCRRSRAFVGGSTVALAILALWCLDAGRAHAAAERSERFHDAWGQLPPTLTINPALHRRLTPAEQPEQVLQLLDRAVAASSSPLPARLYRAAFHLDHGATDLAQRDMQRLTQELEAGPYLTALTEAYAALPDGSTELTGGAPLIDLEPQTPEARFVQAYHVWRSSGAAAAAPLLAHEQLDGFDPAEELRLYLIPLPSQAARMHEEVLALERQRGYRSSTSAYVAGLSQHFQLRYDAAVELYEEALALSPNSRALHNNLGQALWRLSEFEAAADNYELAIERNPAWEMPHEGLVRARLSQGDLDEAAAVIAAAALVDSDWDDGFLAKLRGHVETERALEQLRLRNESGARDSARLALEHYATARAQRQKKLTARPQVCEAILSGAAQPIFTSLLSLLSNEPPLPRRVGLLLEHWPGSIDADSDERLRTYFTALEKRLDAGL
jgi:tetratricopeptide (TPR) repeat protein/tRNA A-37 threonylcarbamoyl transferase component Bud32